MLHVLIPLLIIATSVASFAASDTVSITVGKPETSGITMPNTGDGQYTDQTVNGVKVRRARSDSQPPSSFLYFKTSDDFAKSCTGELYILVEYIDENLGSFNLHYQNAGFPYTSGPSVVMPGSGKHQKTLLHVKDAKLTGAQNYGSDFRFNMPGYQAISRMTVSTKPIPGAPKEQSITEQFKAMEKDIIKPQGMEYTFGNDCDETSGLLFRRLGVTSVESYVTWQSCEPKAKDQWDWSHWDKQVEACKKTGLKWVPFLILGPAYSTPGWFRESSDHFPCVCLEHDTKSKIESLWNPNLPKYIDRFIGEFAKRYKDTGVIESVLLGIQGDFGEAIYSVTGGGWTFDIPGEYHNHGGFWCNDKYALADFQAWSKKKYGSLEKLNRAWGASYASFDTVDFPVKGEKQIKEFRQDLLTASGTDRRKWIDFVDWYRFSMTRWSDEWIAITKKHFPKTPIYLCTGGDAPPEHGSDFAAQCKVAAKHGAGVRITNEASDYGWNYVITRWVASAGRYYGSFFGFEPAGVEDEKGVVARIYNATASGAIQLHDYIPNVVGKPKAIEAQQKHLKYLKKREPKVDVALCYPNVHMTLAWGGFFDKARELRDITDYDYVDESMLRDGALKRYKVLVILHGNIIEESDLNLVHEWVAKGGTLVALDLTNMETVEGKKFPQPDPGMVVSYDKGTVHNIGVAWDEKDKFLAELVRILKESGVPVPDGETDGVFATTMKDGTTLFLNTTDKDVKKTINGKEVTVAAGTITEVGK